MRWRWLLAGVLVLAALWLGPLRPAASHSFTAHMTIHMGVVAVAAPLIATSIAGTRFDPSARHPILFGPLPASLVELIVVWGWHAPALHEAARSEPVVFLIEQASFLASGLLVWIACLGFAASGRTGRSLLGTLGLLLTSIHMTLLGALLAFAQRPLFGHAGLHGLDDQQQGGVVMLLVGGASYLIGGLVLMARVLREPAGANERGAPS
ncbi:MAG TPA: cytochrome c oxidase assembly protein [Geminicoccus sp.]|jgi:putative membrane protein|uniref:cytochrome c oxidase assembly protein n=1 Tax=Geminicoccus sp. TaxID=2024832 RepID=UPI002E347243|nr:cytochrome c oxidase assembly protein [Geminicoccus sp.]HEX2529106.1 cytochrome c oxidase assembly protein [Geminicoccus sp.]